MNCFISMCISHIDERYAQSDTGRDSGLCSSLQQRTINLQSSKTEEEDLCLRAGDVARSVFGKLSGWRLLGTIFFFFFFLVLFLWCQHQTENCVRWQNLVLLCWGEQKTSIMLLYKLEGHLEAFLVSVSSLLSSAQSNAYTKVAGLGMADFATFHREEPQERYKNCQVTKIFWKINIVPCVYGLHSSYEKENCRKDLVNVLWNNV